MSEMRIPYRSGTVTLTSRFGWRNMKGEKNYHKGIDLSGTDKVLVAPCDGVIGSSAIITDRSNLTWQWGNYIRLDTDDGLQIFMCHMAGRKVKVGQRVKAGDVVGIEGNTGYSFGSHCHFEVRKNGESVDPTVYLGIKNEWGEFEMKEKIEKTDERDNKPNEWAKEAVEWAIDSGIIFGDENGDLKLHSPCTREQMLIFLHRFAVNSEG